LLTKLSAMELAVSGLFGITIQRSGRFRCRPRRRSEHGETPGGPGSGRCLIGRFRADSGDERSLARSGTGRLLGLNVWLSHR